jgi:hypothetical protein
MLALLPPINHPILHHEHNFLHRMNILQGIAIDGNDVHSLAGRE